MGRDAVKNQNAWQKSIRNAQKKIAVILWMQRRFAQ